MEQWYTEAFMVCLLSYYFYITTQNPMAEWRLQWYQWLQIQVGTLSIMLLNMWWFDNYLPLAVCFLLAYLFVVDCYYLELPDDANGFLVILAIPFIFNTTIDNWGESSIWTGICLFIIFFILAIAGTMGGGDIKMMGALGLYIPFHGLAIMEILLYSFSVGAVWAIILLLLRRASRKTMFPFGPSLIIGFLLFLKADVLNQIVQFF